MTDIPLDKAATEAAKLLPQVYEDIAQPAAREIGSLLGRSVRAALSPVRLLVWSSEYAEEWAHARVIEKLERRGVAADSLTTPRPQLYAGVVRGLQAAGPEAEPELREMFANLLASATEARTSASVHPAFAGILSEVTPDEARIVRRLGMREPTYLIEGAALYRTKSMPEPHPDYIVRSVTTLPEETGLGTPALIESYLDNLERLGLVRREEVLIDWAAMSPRNPSDYSQEERLEAHEQLAYLQQYGVSELAQLADEFLSLGLITGPSLLKPRPYLRIRVTLATSFGSQLLAACVEPEELGTLSGR